MANPFYNASGAPVTSSPGASATMRAEYALIAAGFDKLPTTLTANALVVVNAGGTALTTFSPGTGITTFLTTPTSANLRAAVTDETGSGALVFATGPTLVAPILGIPASGTLTLCTGLPVSTGISGLGTGVATALAVNTGSAGAVVLFNGALGTPSSGTLTSCTGLPVSTGISGLGTGVATFLATPSSANLLAAMTTKTGTGSLVFGTSPTFTTSIGVGGAPATQAIAAYGASVSTTSLNPAGIRLIDTSSSSVPAQIVNRGGSLQQNVSTGGTFSWLINDVSKMAMDTTGVLTVGGSAVVGGNLTVISSISAVGNVSVDSLNTTNSAVVGGIMAVHTTLGGWTGNANFEVLSVNAAPAAAVSGYTGSGGTGYCFLGRVDQPTAKFAAWNYNGSDVGSITTNGTSTSYVTSSDARLKDNIRDAADAGAIIDSLRVRSWEWKLNGTTEAFGFVAQEEVASAPFAVLVGDDNPDEIEQQWGRDDSKLVPLLVKEIQSLRTRLAAAGL